MSAWSDAFSEVVLAVQPDLDPKLTKGNGTAPDLNQELDQIIVNSARASLWAANHAYAYGDVILPNARNGHRFLCVRPGTSGTTEPTWPTGTGATQSEGTGVNSLLWQEAGPDFKSIYDLRRAKYEALDLKVQRAAVRSQTITDGRGQANSYLYLDLVRERDKYRPVGVS